jgi:SAM-dependent methyltransferase
MDKNVYLRMSEQDAEHWWFVARRRILRDQIASLPLPPGARVLEAGCGPGGNLAMLSEFGQLDAFELDEDARQIASARSGIEVRSGALPGDIGYAPDWFDLIAALDVIEHIEADLESVQALAKLLRPGARLIITVPAYRWLWSEHDDRHHHKRRYTRPAVRRLAEEAGLVVEKCSHFNTILFPLIVGIRFLKKLAGVADKPDDDMPSPFLNIALERIFGAERFPLRYVSLPFGVSILCIARRR